MSEVTIDTELLSFWATQVPKLMALIAEKDRLINKQATLIGVLEKGEKRKRKGRGAKRGSESE